MLLMDGQLGAPSILEGLQGPRTSSPKKILLPPSPISKYRFRGVKFFSGRGYEAPGEPLKWMVFLILCIPIFGASESESVTILSSSIASTSESV